MKRKTLEAKRPSKICLSVSRSLLTNFIHCFIHLVVLITFMCRCFIKVSFFRYETVRSALDVLAICCATPRVYAVFREHTLRWLESSIGINNIFVAAAGRIGALGVQKSALTVLVHYVCAPICEVLRSFFESAISLFTTNYGHMMKTISLSVAASRAILVRYHRKGMEKSTSV